MSAGEVDPAFVYTDSTGAIWGYDQYYGGTYGCNEQYCIPGLQDGKMMACFSDNALESICTTRSPL
jgi:hypothetical protein